MVVKITVITVGNRKTSREINVTFKLHLYVDEMKNYCIANCPGISPEIPKNILSATVQIIPVT